MAQQKVPEQEGKSTATLRLLGSLERDAEYDPNSNLLLVERAEQFLSCPPEDAIDLHLALVKYTLGKALLRESPSAEAVTRLRSISLFEEAASLVQPSTQQKFYASVLLTTGQEYLALSMGDVESNQRNALRCFLAAESCLEPSIEPELFLAARRSMANVLMEWVGTERIAANERAISILGDVLEGLVLSDDPQAYAALHSTQATAYMQRKAGSRAANLQNAIEHFEKSVSAKHEVDDDYDYVQTLSNLAAAYLSLHNKTGISSHLDKAIDALHTALALCEKSTEPMLSAVIYGNLGDAYSLLPESHAFQSKERVPALYLRSMYYADSASDLELFCSSTHSLGVFYARHREWNEAMKSYEQAVAVCDLLRKNAKSRASKASVMASRCVIYEEAAYVLTRIGRFDEALAMSDRGRATFVSEQMTFRARRPAGIPDNIWETFEKASYAFVINEWEQSDQRTDFSSFGDWYDDANLRLNEAIASVKRFDPSFCHDSNLSDCVSLLGDSKTCVLSFCVTRFGTVVFVIPGVGRRQVQMIDVPAFVESDLTALLFSQNDEKGERSTNAWLGGYVNFVKSTTPSIESWMAVMDEVLNTLGSRLLSRTAAELPKGIRQVVLIPGGLLGVLPLHAAPIGAGAETLWDRYEISYAPSLRMFVGCLGRSRSAPLTSGRLYGAINPTMGTVSELPFADYEGKLISRAMSACSFKWGDEATRVAIIEGMEKAQYLHIASHAVFDWQRPRESGISAADGVLTLDELLIGEITTKRLEHGVQVARRIRCVDPRLVTLSACESGISDFFDGSPGEYLGIPAGFLLIGYPTVVSSLWTVNDLSCALLMSRFYGELARGERVGAALRTAGQWLRAVTVKELEVWFASERDREDADRMMSYTHASRLWRRFVALDPNERPFCHVFHYAGFAVTGDASLIVDSA